jgi:hypothetical protein
MVAVRRRNMKCENFSGPNILLPRALIANGSASEDESRIQYTNPGFGGVPVPDDLIVPLVECLNHDFGPLY